MIVSFPAILSSIKTRKDRTLAITAETAYEFNGEDASMLFSFANNEIQLVLSDSIVQEKDIPEIQVDSSVNEKTPSQRLRSVLYVYWEQSGKKTSFDVFYLQQMNRLIDIIKEKLE